MNIQSIFDSVKRKYTPLTTNYFIYLEETVYCTILLDDRNLRISLNFNDNRVYVFYVDKTEIKKNINDILEATEQLQFKPKNNMLYIDLDNQIEKSIQIFVNTVLAFDQYVAKKNSKIKKAIAGDLTDSVNNIVNAPTNLIKCYVQFKGGNNSVSIHPEANLKNLFIEFLGDNSVVEIGKNVSLSANLRLGYNCEVKIGDSVSSTNGVYMTCAEKTKIEIGSDCMFATNNQIRTDDAHAIYDCNTGLRVNKSSDISIGKHVWIGYGATVLGGSKIGDGCIIGMGSIVKKKFPNNCVVAGIPAKVIKKDVFWQRPNVLHFDEGKGREVIDFKNLSYCNSTEEI